MVHGWRLDPILLFSQVLIIVTVLVAGWKKIKRFNCQHVKKLKKKKRKIVFFLLISWFQVCNNNFELCLKKSSQLFSLVFLCVLVFVTTASAIDLDEATRTVVADPAGKTIVLTPEQVKRGVYLTLLVVHVRWNYKTNPNVGLDSEALFSNTSS
jgi:hypothetical protein